MDYHSSEERVVHGMVLLVVGPGGATDDEGGICYFLNDGHFPSMPLDLTDARRALESARAGAKIQSDLASALERAIGELESVQ